MARLDISQLYFSVGTTDILRNVDLSVEDGKCLALLGPSGCGKTTTLRCVAGFVTPTAGEISINGTSILGRPTHKRNVGLVFQDYALFPHMTVVDNVAYGLKRRGVAAAERKTRTDAALALVQLEGFEDRRPNQLSGGQQQRVALARALVVQPDVLLLDEPLGALDRRLRDQMQVELKRIQREAGITTIIVTHDQEEALSLSDRIAVMLDGRIEEVGTPADLYRRPKSRAVMEFLGASNILDGTVEGDAAGLTRLRVGPSCVLHAKTPPNGASKLRVGIRPERITISHDAPANAVNHLTGHVLEAVYKGTHAEVYVDVSAAAPLLVRWRDSSERTVEDVRIGDPVHLSIEPDAILIFEQE